MKFLKNFGFQMSIFFRKILHDFPTFFENISTSRTNQICEKFLKVQFTPPLELGLNLILQKILKIKKTTVND